MSVSRRQFLYSAAGLLLSGALASCGENAGSNAANELNIYGWADYLHEDVIPEFQKQTGITVIYDTFASNEALLAKVEAGGSNYDLILPSNYAVAKLRKGGYLKRIDKEQLPNFKHLMERFQNPGFDPHCQYSVPYMFGTTGIGFNKKAFPGGNYPRDWDAFWDKQLAGRMTLLEDARETLGFALKHRGHSYNSTDPQLIAEACNDLIAQKSLVMCYSSDQVITYLSSGDALLSLAYSGDVCQAWRTNPEVGYIIPASGASMWVDSFCIPKNAPHVENALKWINFLLEPRIAAMNANHTFYATPNKDALPMVEPKLLADKNLYPPESILSKCEELKDIGAALYTYDLYWTQLKCA